ncbi:uncharacterized protein [Primulina eburnea]|uniref:uncharacterized protein isoform X1 n=1 Tax=Primulina eburnea TaxID=1245227 RepID=UPI003C6CA1A5
MYAHTGGEDSTGIGGRPQGRPPRGTGPENSGGQRNFDKILQLDSFSLVDVPSTYSFDENTTDIRSTEAGGVEILAADVETMTSVSIPEEESECSVLFLLDSGDESEKTLVEAVIMVE